MLTEKQAYATMVVFLEAFCQRSNSEDVLGMLGDLMVRDDGTTADPAAWSDWQQAVAAVTATIKIPMQSKDNILILHI